MIQQYVVNFHCAPTNLREGNVFSRVYQSVSVLVHGAPCIVRSNASWVMISLSWDPHIVRYFAVPLVVRRLNYNSAREPCVFTGVFSKRFQLNSADKKYVSLEGLEPTTTTELARHV